MKLSEAILSIEFSDAEKDRLGTLLLDTTSLPYKVITSKAQAIQHHDFWTQAQKHFKVTGFRVGHVNSKNIILKKALDSLKLRPGSQNNSIWPLYRNCFRYYVHDVLKNLDRLVVAEEMLSSTGSLTQQIFETVKEANPLYDVPLDEIEQIYQIWGFERIDNFSAIFSDKSISAQLVKRLIQQEQEKVRTEIGRELSEVKKMATEESQKSSTNSNALSEKLSVIEKRLDSYVTDLKTEIEKSSIGVQKQASKFDETFKELSKNLSAQPTSNIKPEELVEVHTKLDTINKKIQEHDLYFLNQDEPKSLENSSTPFSMHDIYQKWRDVLVGTNSPSSKELFLSIIDLFRCTKVFVSENPFLLVRLLEQLPNAKIKTIAASPLWLNETDWADSFNWISETSEELRILTISDFDVGFQDAYLVPSLVKWIEDAPQSSFNKVFLVPSKPNLEDVSPRILEFSAVFNPTERLEEIENTLKNTRATTPDSMTTYKESLSYKNLANVEFEAQLRAQSKRMGLALPPLLVKNYVTVYTAFCEHLNPTEAANISTEVSLIPWVRLSRGDTFAQFYKESLNTSLWGIV